jgi:signal transduction histidine kinase
MRHRHSLFSKLVIILAVAIGLSGLSLLLVGIEGFRVSENYVEEQIRRHVLSTAAGQVGTYVELGEWDKVGPFLQTVRGSANLDEASLAFISRIEEQLRSSSPDARSLRSLSEAWQIYQINEVLRLVDDHEATYRTVVVRGWAIWLVFALLFILIGRQMFKSAVRPVRYVTEYFRTMDFSRGVQPLFPDVESRRKSGVDNAAEEVQALFRGMESLVGRVQEFRNINIHRLMEQRARAEVLASASRDAIFFLQGSQVVWCNRIGADLLGVGSRRSDLPMDLEKNSDARDGRLANALLLARMRATPIEWSPKQSEDGEIQSFLFTQATASWRRWGDQLTFDAVIVGQDVSWIRQAENAKSHFVGLLSHEVKTPVTSLLMATRLLQRAASSLTPVQKKLVDSSVRDVERLRELIDELFAASRFDLDAEKLNFRMIDLRRLVSQAVRATRPEAEARCISMDLSFECRESEVMARADAPRVSWTLTQLVTYVLRHAPRNSRIEVRMADALVESGPGFQIIVRSVGAPPVDDSWERIFQRTFAHYDLRVARSNSTGMALAIAREIAVGHGGALALNPEYRDGAEFILTLPQGRGPDAIIRAEC